MNNTIYEIVADLKAAKGISFDRDSMTTNVAKVTDIVAKIKNSELNTHNEYAEELEGKLLKSAERWVNTTQKALKQLKKIEKISDEKLLAAATKELNKLVKVAEDEVAFMLVDAEAVKMFYGIMEMRDEYNSHDTFINQDLYGFGPKAIRIDFYQVKRPKSPENCYHFRVEHVRRIDAHNRGYSPAMLKKVFGADYRENYKSSRSYDYDIVLSGGKWHVYTGDYHNEGPRSFAHEEKIKTLKKDTAIHLGAFNFDEFHYAKKLCFDHSDPLTGKLLWSDEVPREDVKSEEDEFNPRFPRGEGYDSDGRRNVQPTPEAVGMPMLGKIQYAIISNKAIETAKILKRRLVKLDSDIEKLANKSISDIFNDGGIEEYRRLEAEAMEAAVRDAEKQAQAAAPGYVLERRDTNESDYCKNPALDKDFEMCATVEQAKKLAAQDFAQFKADVFADKKFRSGLGRNTPAKVYQRVNTRDLIKDLKTANFDWIKNDTGTTEEYNLSYPGDDNIDYLIFKDKDKYRCLKLENFLLYQYHADVVNHPYVRSIGASTSLSKAKSLCMRDIENEVKSRKSDARKILEKIKLAFKGQSRYQDY